MPKLFDFDYMLVPLAIVLDHSGYVRRFAVRVFGLRLLVVEQ